MQELARSCPVFVLAQTPTAQTQRDFWSMVVSQRARLVCCLHGPAEMLDPFFPVALNATETYGDCVVRLEAQFERQHCIERTVRANGERLTIVQAKCWPKK